jgi:hypothetical protein
MSVEKAEAVVAQLEQKRSACVRHGTELQDERANVALSAHTGDAKARKRLDEINSEIAVHSSELASLDAALRAASERLEKARQHEAQKADRQRATALRQELVAFREHGRALKVAFDAIALHGNGLWQTHTRMQQLGVNFPNGQQLDAIGGRALMAACAQTPWRRRFDAVPPRERYDIAEAVEGWIASIEKQIAARLGEPQENENAADAA